jgi:hypothetical protein
LAGKYFVLAREAIDASSEVALKDWQWERRMGAERDKYDWIEDFSILLTRRAILSISRDPELELFAGSKLLASVWLAAVAGVAGSLGGLLPSGALWGFFVYPIIWLMAVVITWIIAWRVTIRLVGSAIAFLAGWCMFWGLLTGAVAGWGAQLASAGWAYGIAGGIGFLIGITHGNLQHADIRGHDGWFMTGTVWRQRAPVWQPGCRGLI